jgi:DNA-directed RNA polymerase subunit beta'
VYDGLKALTGTGGSLTRDEKYSGVLDLLAGKVRSPGVGGTGGGGGKAGFFQKQVMKRRQDFSGRSIIIPEPKMDLDELGLPEEIAWKMYQPFVERQLVQQGYKFLDAFSEVEKRTPAARRALNRVIQDRPVFLKRDPVLHKFNVMAFKPRIVSGKAIEIHPLVTSGYNADFDGDAMSVFLPIRPKAVAEAQKMFPSNNLFSPTTGSVMYTPGHEALLGLYLMSKPGKRTNKKYKTEAEAMKAFHAGEIAATDIIRVGGHEATIGRLKIEKALPAKLREIGKKKISDMRILDKKATGKLLTTIATEHSGDFGEAVNALKDMGNEYVTEEGFSIGLSDFAVINKEIRDQLIAIAEEDAAKVRASKMSEAAQERKIVEIFQAVDKKLDALNAKKLKEDPTNIYKMVTSGSRGKPEQLQQIVSSPMLVMDAKSRVVPFLIPRSYSEGMDLASYWTTLHGARKGTIQKVQGVRDPGYLSKQIMNSTMNQLVTEKDCGTDNGVSLSLNDPDIADRYLAKGVRIGGARARRGDLVTPNLMASARKAKKSTLFVRSPLRCEAEHGICQKCMGLATGGRSYDIGDNVGVLAGQAVGEPSTQLAMRVFHTGGLAKGQGAQTHEMFSRLQKLLRLPKRVPNAASLARASGAVTKIEKAPQGGEFLTIGGMKHYVPTSQERTVRLNERVRKGDSLSDGVIDPRGLLALRDIEAVQDFIAGELLRVLGSAVPVRRRNVEVVVKSLTNVTHIDDESNHPEWVAGDVRPLSQVQAWNRKHPGKQVVHTPVLKGVDILPLEMQEDWVARLNFQKLNRTITQAAREGWRSDVNGFHPVPAAARGVDFGQAKDRMGSAWRGQY